MEMRVKALLEHHDVQDIRLKEHEEAFLQDIINKCGDPEDKLTEKQEAWVTVLHERYLEGRIYK